MDRGLIKWGAFLMPEASNSLNKWHEEDKYEERIELFEDEIEAINLAITEAVETDSPIEIRHYISHLKKHADIKCNIIKYYPERHCIRVRELSYLGVSEIRMVDIAAAWIMDKDEVTC